MGVADAVRPAIPPMFAAAPAALMPSPATEDLRTDPDGPSEPRRVEGRFSATPGAPPGRGASAARPSRPHAASGRAPAAPDLVPAARAPYNDDARPFPQQFRAGSDAASPSGDFRRERSEHTVEASRAGEPSALAAASPPARFAATAPVPRAEDGEPERLMTPVDLPAVEAPVSLSHDGGSAASPVSDPLRHRALRIAIPAATDDAEPQGASDSDARRQFARLRALGDGTRREPIASPRSPGPPVVRVSIGRVEVRAVAARAPAAPPAPRGPALPGVTLARYLARNRGGPA